MQVDLVAAITQGGLGSSGDERVADGDMQWPFVFRVLDVVKEKVYSQPGTRHDCLGRWPRARPCQRTARDLLVALAGR